MNRALLRHIVSAACFVATLTHAAIDTTPPQITAPGNMNKPATGALTPVSINNPSATDDRPGRVRVTNDAPPYGFPVGNTVVTFTAIDAAGNVAKDSMTVTISDDENPSFKSLPGTIEKEPTGFKTYVERPVIRATDNADPAPAVNFTDWPDDSLFPTGTTTVNLEAHDRYGNSTTGSFKIKIEDKNPPELIIPMEELLLEEAKKDDGTGKDYAEIDYGDDSAEKYFNGLVIYTDDVDHKVEVTNNAPANGRFNVGTHTVTYTAYDHNPPYDRDHTGDLNHARLHSTTATLKVVVVKDMDWIDRSGVVGDAAEELLVGMGRKGPLTTISGNMANVCRDIAIVPDNRRVLSLTNNGEIYVYDVAPNDDGVPTITRSEIAGNPVSLSSVVSWTPRIVCAPDALFAFVAGRGGGEYRVVRVNLKAYAYENPADGTERSYGAFEHKLVVYRNSGPRKVEDLAIHPSGDRIYVLLEGSDGNEGGRYKADDYGQLDGVDVTPALGLIGRTPFKKLWDNPLAIKLPKDSLADRFYGVSSLTISPDGDYALITALGTREGQKITPFGVIPGADEATGGVLVVDLDEPAFLQHIPSVVEGERTAHLRSQIRSAGILITHPKVAWYEHMGGSAAVDRGVMISTVTFGFYNNSLATAFAYSAALSIARDTYKDYGALVAYDACYPTDMAAATETAIAPTGDVGIVTFRDTNNYGVLALGNAKTLAGYGSGNIPEFVIAAAAERTVNGLDLGFGIGSGDTSTRSIYEWIAPREVTFSADGSRAYIGLGGGAPGKPRYFAVVDVNKLRQRVVMASFINPVMGLPHSNDFFSLRRPTTEPYFWSAREVAGFSGEDADGDAVSSHTEAFNRFNAQKVIKYGDKRHLVSMNENGISDPGSKIHGHSYPFDYVGAGYLLPHSGVGYLYNYNQHDPYSTNVGSATVIRAIERVGRKWHEKHLDGDTGCKDHPYFIVTDMSHPGEGLVQNHLGEYRHHSVRNGLQVNIQYPRSGTGGHSNKPFDFVLSNGPTSPTDNSSEGNLSEFDWQATHELIKLFLNQSSVSTLAIDPKVRDMIKSGAEVDLADDPRVEIHGSTDEDFPNTRRDMDSYMLVGFKTANVYVDGSAPVYTSENGIAVSYIEYDGSSAGPHPVTFDFISTYGTAEVFIGDSDTSKSTASVKVFLRGDTRAYELYFDHATQNKVKAGETYQFADFLGVLWLKILDDPTQDKDNPTTSGIIIGLGSPTGGSQWIGRTIALELDLTQTSNLPVSSGDSDGDGIKDFADGFNRDGQSDTPKEKKDDRCSALQFTPFKIRVRGNVDKNMGVRFEYDASNPVLIKSTNRGKDQLLPDIGSLRIWKKPGNEARKYSDYISSGYTTLEALGFEKSQANPENWVELTVYLEAVRPSNKMHNRTITVSLDVDAGGVLPPLVTRSVSLVGERLDLQIDSNNDGTPNAADDAVEDIAGDPEHPGRILIANWKDADGDGIPDFNDFSVGSNSFASVKIKLPSVSRMRSDKATITINYSASDPTKATNDAPAPGHLRLWKSSESSGRDPRSDYIAPGSYTPAELGLSSGSTKEFFLEAVSPSMDAGDQALTVKLDPDSEDGRTDFPYQDTVRVTVYADQLMTKFAIDSEYRRLDLDGMPFAEIPPDARPEQDLTFAGYYIDAYSLSPHFAGADLSLPTLGPDLKLELRRIAGLTSYVTVGSGLLAIEPVGPDTLLGDGWRTNIGMRVIIRDNIIYVYDDSGKEHRFTSNGHPIPRSFMEASTERSSVTVVPDPDDPGKIAEIRWTRNFWTVYTFEACDPQQSEFGKRPLIGQFFRISTITDRNLNEICFDYRNSNAAYPDSMYEADFPEREIAFTYASNANGVRLTAVQDPMGNTITYSFGGSRGTLSQVKLPAPGGGGTVTMKYQYKTLTTDGYAPGTKVHLTGFSSVINPRGKKSTFDYQWQTGANGQPDETTREMVLKSVTIAEGSNSAVTASFTTLKNTADYREVKVIDVQGSVQVWEFHTGLIPASMKNGVGYAQNAFMIPVMSRLKRTFKQRGPPTALPSDPFVNGTIDEDMIWQFYFSGDTFYNLTKTIDPNGIETRFEYGHVNGFDHYRYNRPSGKIVDPGTGPEDREHLQLRSGYRFDPAHRRQTDAIAANFYGGGGGGVSSTSHHRSFRYDEFVNLVETYSEFTEGQDKKVKVRRQYLYDDYGNPLVMIDEEGRVIYRNRTPDGKGWIDELVTYREFTEELDIDEFTEADLPSEVDGRVKTFFDANGRPYKKQVIIRDPDQPGQWVTHETLFEHDARGNLIKQKKPSVYDHDSNGMVNPEILIEYDKNGNKKKVTDARGMIVDTVYDARDRVTLTTQQAGSRGLNDPIIRKITYDKLGNPKTVKDPRGNLSEFYCDALGRPVLEITHNSYKHPEDGQVDNPAEWAKTRYIYKLDGKMASTDALNPRIWKACATVGSLGDVTLTTYDRAYRATEVRQYATQATSIGNVPPAETDDDKVVLNGYDANGNRTRITLKNPTGSGDQVTELSYDELNRLIHTEVVMDDGSRLISSKLYDRSDRIVAAIDAAGGTVQIEYDATGRPVLEVTRISGTLAEYQDHDACNYLIDRNDLDDDDMVTENAHDGIGRTIRSSQRRIDYNTNQLIWIHTETRRDALGRVIKQIFNSDRTTTNRADEQITAFTYDRNGNRRSEASRRENADNPGSYDWITTVYEYDAFNRPIRTTHPKVYDGEKFHSLRHPVEEMEYDRNGNVVATKDARGVLTETFYDGRGQPRVIILNSDGGSGYGATEGVLKFHYDAGGRMWKTEARREAGGVGGGGFIWISTQTTFDIFGRPRVKLNNEGNEDKAAYDCLDNVLTRTDPKGGVTRHEYDLANRMVMRVLPEAKCNGVTEAPTTYMGHDAVGRLIWELDPNGGAWYHVYDSLGRRIQTTNPENDTMSMTYDQVGNLRRETDFMGVPTTYAYDRLNRRRRQIDADNDALVYAYNLAGQVTSITDPEQNTTRFYFDLMGRVIKEKLPGNTNSFRAEYNLTGEPVKSTDANGLAEWIQYDSFRNKTRITDHQGNVTKFEYDVLGNAVKKTDPEDHVTEYAHDRMNRVVFQKEEKNKITRIEFDANGNHTKIIDAAGNETRFEYDALDRRTAHIFPDQKKYTYEYDATTNVLEITTPRGKTISQTFDLMDRVKTKTYENNDVVYTYNANGDALRVEQTTDSKQWTTAYTYDALQRMTSTTFQFPDREARTVSYDYDKRGARTQMTTPTDRTVDYTIDPKGQITRIQSTLKTTPVSATFTYDEAGRTTAKNYSNNTARSYYYDTLNRITASSWHHTTRDRELLVHEYTYSKTGMRKYEKRGFRNSEGTMSSSADLYRYDELYRLTEAKYGVASALTDDPEPDNPPGDIDYASANPEITQNLVLDLLNNRQSLTESNTVTGTRTVRYNSAGGGYSPNSRNWITSIDGQSLTWDDDGNLTNDGTFNYTWDAQDRLTSASKENQDVKIDCVYDDQGRRLEKKVFDYAGHLDQHTYYIYDGWSVIEEIDGFEWEVSAEHVNGRALDEHIASRLGNQIVFFYQNSIGNVDLLTDANGNALQRYRYDIHGNVRVLDADGNELGGANSAISPYLFTGRRYDRETGLYYFRTRYYSATMGRFISQDPLDYIDGMNVYAYAGGNPANYTDPMGTSFWSSIRNFFSESWEYLKAAGTVLRLAFTPNSWMSTQDREIWDAYSQGVYEGFVITRDTLTFGLVEEWHEQASQYQGGIYETSRFLAAMGRNIIVGILAFKLPFLLAAHGKFLAIQGGISLAETAVEYGIHVATGSKEPFHWGATLAKNFALNVVTAGVGSKLKATSKLGKFSLFMGRQALEAAGDTVIDVMRDPSRGFMSTFAFNLGAGIIGEGVFTALKALGKKAIGVGKRMKARFWNARRASVLADKIKILADAGYADNIAKRMVNDGKICFVAGTLVLMGAGLKPIEAVEPGDTVLSKSDVTTTQTCKKVAQTFVAHPNELFHITYQAGEDEEEYTLVCTGEHPFRRADQGWTIARRLGVDDRLELTDGRIGRVTDIAVEYAPDGSTFTTYNFEVADFHTYYVLPEGQTDRGAAAWVHNKCVYEKGIQGLMPGRKGSPGISSSIIDEVVASSARRRNKQITEGARGIAKKQGHARKKGIETAFAGIKASQANAETIIRKTMENPADRFIGDRVVDVYNAAGQGIRFDIETRKFIGFLEGELRRQ